MLSIISTISFKFVETEATKISEQQNFLLATIKVSLLISTSHHLYGVESLVNQDHLDTRLTRKPETWLVNS